MSEASYLDKLNPPQREAVEHFRGPILVLAGAGSGKTRVLTRRVAHLVLANNVHPQSILAVTFTNKATAEMRERLKDLLGEAGERLWVATFHSSALRILRRHAAKIGFNSNFVVYDPQDCKEIVKRIIKERNIDEKRYPPSFFLRGIDDAKNKLILPEQMAANSGSYEGGLLAEVYDLYQRRLLEANAMDFGDLLTKVVLLFKKHPEILEAYQHALQFVLVDEFQDTNMVQYMFIEMITRLHKNLFVVGDDDQSIYAFRGATIQNILNFEKDYPGTKVIKLEENYRSSGNILDAANEVIAKNLGRKGKKLWTSAGKGKPVYTYCGYDEDDEARFIAQKIAKEVSAGKRYSDVAVFYRTNAQSRALEEQLFSAGIPYRVYGGQKFYERKEIKDVLAYLRLLVNEADTQAFLRVINTPPRGIGPQTVQTLQQLAGGKGISLLTAAYELADENKNIRQFTELMTLLRNDARTLPLGDLIRAVINKTEYGQRLEASKDVTAVSRMENLSELEALGKSMAATGADPLASLQNFMDRVSLTAGDELPDEEIEKSTQEKGRKTDTVSLSTLHLAKGLEFPVVFFTGVEEGLVPHHRAILEPKEIEEERRLCYVGITRAMETLYLTRATTRGMFSSGGGFGSTGMFREPSRFVFDIVPSCLESLGGDFFSSGTSNVQSFSTRLEVDLDFEDPLPGTIKVKKKKERLAKAGITLTTADELDPRKLAALEDLAPGVKVFHPSFGDGVVEALNQVETPKNAKVLVRFQESEFPKTLVVRHAKLRIADLV